MPRDSSSGCIYPQRYSAVLSQHSSLDGPHVPKASNLKSPENLYHTNSKSVSLSALRRLRYSRAEQSLVSRSMRMPLEASPEELKIRVLEEAVANLSAYAREARENGMELQQRLRDRSMEPENYRSLQKERWREERRHVVLEQNAKIAQKELASLACGTVAQLSVPDKRTRNLVSFFDRSQTRSSLRFKSPPSFDLRTIKNTSPLMLRPPSPSKRVPLSPLTTTAFPKLREPLYARRNQPQQTIKTTLDEELFYSNPQSTFTGTTAGFVITSSSSTAFNDEDVVVTSDGGIAWIYSPEFAYRRSKADIMAELGHVPLPDYAVHLLEDFAYTHDEQQTSSVVSSMVVVDVRPSFDQVAPMEKPKTLASLFTVLPSRHPAPVMTRHPQQATLPFPNSTPENEKRRGPASFGSLLPKGEANNGMDSSHPSRHSIHVPLSISSRRFGMKKSMVNRAQASAIAATSPSENNAGGRRRSMTLVSRIIRPFSLLGRS